MAPVMAHEAGKAHLRIIVYMIIWDLFLPFNILNINYCYGLNHTLETYMVYFLIVAHLTIYIYIYIYFFCFYLR